VLGRRRLLRLAVTGAAAAVSAGVVRSQGAPAWSEEARRRLTPGSADERDRVSALRRRLLDEGEAELAAGRGEEALERFEQAASMLHAADTEIRIVRAHMALGGYRRALAFCAHAAGAHRDQPGGTALYAWLLHIGGQPLVARRVLDQAIESQAPPLLIETAAQLRLPWPSLTELLLQSPWRLAPLASGAVPAPDGRCVGTATLLPSGEAALLPAVAVADARAVWVRNGLGHTVRAGRAVATLTGGLVALALERPLLQPPWRATVREPFAGSPGSTFEYTPDAQARAAWPLTRQGFFPGAAGTRDSSRPLGLGAPPGPRGGPVFDRSGHWVGVALGAAEGSDRLLALSALPAGLLAAAAWQDTGERAPPAPSGSSASLDFLYERALPGALQIIVAR
jgi:hypothetical protein